jgi:LPS-assembly lipoprotein
VVVPQGRVAYLLRENLDDLIGHDKTRAPLWRLDIQVVQIRDPRGLRLDNVAERYDLGLTVKYSLTSIASGKVVRTGEVVSQVSYDAANAPYAGISARQDSQERAAADAARRIQIQLAGWMAGRAGD